MLQFDSLMESLGERLTDYAKLIPKLLSGISDPAQLAHVEPEEVRLLKDLHQTGFTYGRKFPSLLPK